MSTDTDYHEQPDVEILLTQIYLELRLKLVICEVNNQVSIKTFQPKPFRLSAVFFLIAFAISVYYHLDSSSAPRLLRASVIIPLFTSSWRKSLIYTDRVRCRAITASISSIVIKITSVTRGPYFRITYALLPSTWRVTALYISKIIVKRVKQHFVYPVSHRIWIAANFFTKCTIPDTYLYVIEITRHRFSYWSYCCTIRVTSKLQSPRVDLYLQHVFAWQSRHCKIGNWFQKFQSRKLTYRN